MVLGLGHRPGMGSWLGERFERVLICTLTHGGPRPVYTLVSLQRDAK